MSSCGFSAGATGAPDPNAMRRRGVPEVLTMDRVDDTVCRSSLCAPTGLAVGLALRARATPLRCGDSPLEPEDSLGFPALRPPGERRFGWLLCQRGNLPPGPEKMDS